MVPNEHLARWAWRFVPLPDPHVVGLIVGLVCQAIRPWPVVQDRELAGFAGVTLLGCGGIIIALAVREVAPNVDHRRRTLVSTGPYGVSRNPMYVGWTLLYAGATERNGHLTGNVRENIERISEPLLGIYDPGRPTLGMHK